MNRAPALRKLLAVEPLYPDEIFEVMGGHRLQVLQAIEELKRTGELHAPGGPKRLMVSFVVLPNRSSNGMRSGQSRPFGDKTKNFL